KPSDPSTPTFTTVTITSGIAAFSLSLTGNLTVNGSTSVSGLLSAGGAPVHSTAQDNELTKSQRQKGPIPYVDFTAFMPAGGCNLTTSFATPTSTMSSGSATVTLSSAQEFKNGCGIIVEGGTNFDEYAALGSDRDFTHYGGFDDHRVRGSVGGQQRRLFAGDSDNRLLDKRCLRQSKHSPL